MPRELQPWGGDVGLPRWIARLLHRKPDTVDTPERAHERHKPEYSDRTVLENVDRAAMFGAFTQPDKHPHGNDPD